MVQIQGGRRLVPILLGIGMLGTVVAAGLAPTIGAVAAQSNCQYGACPSGSSNPFPWWIVAVVLAVVVVAALLGLMLFRRRPPAAPAAPEAWEPPAGAAGSAAGGPTPPSAAVAVGAGTAAGAGANYMESPDDVGQIPPVVGAGAAGAAAGEAEPDIDSLMAELDKISGEILKKAPKSGSGSSGASDAADEAER
ncbi:MAG: hypothetical protein L3K02_04910 [Thermoplasmata archaeon]|nr:hypothetical protein [Thermoplasmata archaeon]